MEKLCDEIDDINYEYSYSISVSFNKLINLLTCSSYTEINSLTEEDFENVILNSKMSIELLKI